MNIELNNKILDLIHSSVISECGDGDAIWLSKFTTIDELIPLIDMYNQKNNTGWELKKQENHILWGKDQELAIITDDENFFNSQPSWIILKINY